jgi:hypothetical protein
LGVLVGLSGEVPAVKVAVAVSQFGGVLSSQNPFPENFSET